MNIKLNMKLCDHHQVLKILDDYVEKISESYPHTDRSELYRILWDYPKCDDIKDKIHLGLCCINNTLRQQKPTIFNSRSCTRATFSIEKAQDLSLKNVKDLIPIIEWNNNHNIKCFRLSSNIFPHFTDTETEKYTIDHAKDDLKIAGNLLKKYGHRVLMHPGQYNQVAAISDNVFQKTIFELDHHASILEAMGIDNNGVLIVHGGGVYGDKPSAKKRWVENYFKLPQRVQDRLVIENCERCYCLEDVIDISQKIEEKGGNLPVVFDSHHYECYNLLHPNETQKSLDELLPLVIKSWGNRRPVMHISQQGSGRCGHHSDYITHLPDYFLNIPRKYNVSFDLEIEAKAKEAAIFRLYDKYPDLFK
tara:strand:+ start:1245 stop:2333 length:1089 start_codon:yes stop_codon:yes gene_type:complete